MKKIIQLTVTYCAKSWTLTNGKSLKDVGKENTEKNIRTDIRKQTKKKNESRNESCSSKCK